MNAASGSRRVATVAVVVAGYDEAIAWYTGRLGFTLTGDVDLGEGKLGLGLFLFRPGLDAIEQGFETLVHGKRLPHRQRACTKRGSHTLTRDIWSSG